MKMLVRIEINKKTNIYKNIGYIYTSDVSIRLFRNILDLEPIAKFETDKVDYMTVETI